MLRVCTLLPGLTPWGVWRELEWWMFQQLIDEWTRLDTQRRRQESRG